MSRHYNVPARCPRCHMHLNVCVCAMLPAIQTRTRLSLILHRNEVHKPTNTGQIAALCLTNSQVIVRGDRLRAESISWPASSQPLLVFPYEDAAPISDWVSCDRPITLIVPDGSWRQAAKMKRRAPELADVPSVSFPMVKESRYRLRRELHPDGLSTMEAIARAMGILEGVQVEATLMRTFQIVVERLLWTRGEIGPDQVTGGIPLGAKRHDPLSGWPISRS